MLTFYGQKKQPKGVIVIEYQVKLGKPEAIGLEKGRLVIKDDLVIKEEVKTVMELVDKFGEVMFTFPFFKGGRQLKLPVKRGESAGVLAQRVKDGLNEFHAYPNGLLGA